MSAVPRSNSPVIPFELRNATLALTALVLKTTDLELLARALEEQFGATPLFDHDPVVLDLAQVRDDPQAIDFAALAAMLRERRMLAIGVEGGSAEQTEAAAAAGLGQTSTFATVPRA
ncbi:MAG: septum site-determining protein MinC, partial [Caldimonas sp.]